MKYIMVTGGAGYVGHRLVSHLLAAGHNVLVYDLMIYGHYFRNSPRLKIVKGDIRDIDRLKECLPHCHTVIHLACISNDPSCDLDSRLTESVNMDAFEPLVLMAKHAGVRRFINASSSSVYGIKEEEKVTEDLKCEPLTLYSKYKLECERILLKHHEDDFETVSVRSATVFGHSPRMRFDTVLNMFCLQGHNGPITIHGEGTQARPLIHIDDISKLYTHLVSLPHLSGGSFNYGLDNISLVSLASKISHKVVKKDSDDKRSYRISSRKAIEVFGIHPEVSFESGIFEIQNQLITGGYVDPEKNSIYYNVKRMKEIGLT
jgi:nucleoside-diphosphate-sugar epimerase